MLDAFAAAYPAKWSWRAKLLLPTVHPMTFVRAVHLALMFPLGIASFVFLVVTLAVGGSLIWTLIGPIVLLVGLYLSRWFGDLEAWRVRHVAGIELRRPPTGIERGQSFRQQVKTRLIDPSTWTGLVYLLIQFPIGIAMFVGLVVGGAVTGAFVGAPFYATFVDGTDINEAISVSIDLGFWSTVLTEPEEIAIALVPVGVLVYFVLVHAINITTAIHASWARLMLGSRAEPIPLGPAETPPPPTDEPPPGGDIEGPDVPPPLGGDPVAPALEELGDLPAAPATVEMPEPAEMPEAPAAPDELPPEAEPSPIEPQPERLDGDPPEPPVIVPSPSVLEPAAVVDERSTRPHRLGIDDRTTTLTRVAEPVVEPLANQLVPELDAPLLVATGEPLDALTPREREVLTLIARGYSNAAIAETFVISEGTVKTHVKRVLSKLGLRDRTQAAIYAYETSFVAARSSADPAALEPIVLTRVR